jgi:putative ABC transport system substrate-binding protein
LRRRRLLLAAAGWAAAASLPLAHARARGEQRRVIFLDDTEGPQGVRLQVFRDCLREVGLLPQRISLEIAAVAGSDERALRREIPALVKRDPAAFVTGSSDIARKGLAFMADIPLVMGTQVDPVKLGVDDPTLPRRHNVTGFTYDVPIEAKVFEVMADAFPAAKRIAVIADRPWMEFRMRESDLALARERFGMKLDLVVPESPDRIDREFGRILANHAEAGYVPRSDVGFFSSKALIGFFQRHRLPNLFANDSELEAGALMSYGVRRQSHWLPMAMMLRVVLDGVPAREVPFERPKDFVLGVNATQAAKMGIPISKSILRRANLVV